ncbi:MAG: hypothetical protein M1819_003894 [Sarea resinae]|nr:MAG: hypothetical protein M1819_003894 [Sarea resinae]
MPPVNSPLETPPIPTPDPSSYLSPLSPLDTPVLDLASTLTTQAEDDADEDNVRFLRAPSDDEQEEHQSVGGVFGGQRSTRQRPHSIIAELERVGEENQRRIRRAAAERRRYTPERMRAVGELAFSAYGDRIPNQQQVYDWAPASSEDDEDDPASRLRALARLVPVSDLDSLRSASSNRVNLGHGRGGAARVSSIPSRIPEPPIYSNTESSLRTAALLQSVRRHPRFSARSRDRLQNYILERERTGHDVEERDRGSSSRALRQQNSASQAGSENINRQSNIRARVDAYRARYLSDPVPGSASSRYLEEAIKYLERLRFSSSYEESLSSAAAGGFVRSEFFADNHEDFILDTASIGAPAESSWLKVGGVFSGSQHAAPLSASQLYRLQNTSFIDTRIRDALLVNTGGPLIVDGSAPARGGAPPRRPIPFQAPAARAVPNSEEKWPVKVTISGVDYDTMTLTGTMEAFNVPDKSSKTGETSIVTFLEGEIIDFNAYTLETKSFKSDPKIDGTYWRQLEPFKNLTDDEMVRNLVSKKWLTDELARKWILMRWKEKCFITPSTSNRSGLTISGFYYVSLRRDTGAIEGLYFDPSSSPYQHLTLTPEKRVFPTYEFR